VTGWESLACSLLPIFRKRLTRLCGWIQKIP